MVLERLRETYDYEVFRRAQKGKVRAKATFHSSENEPIFACFCELTYPDCHLLG